MLFAVGLTLLLTMGSFLLCACCRAMLYARLVRRVGLSTPVLVGKAGDAVLPQRVCAAFYQNSHSHLEPCGGVVVLDCGVDAKTREACFAAVDKPGSILFLSPEKLCDYLVASAKEK